MITKSFIEKVHSAFDEFHYCVYRPVLGDFMEAAIDVLTRAKDFESAANAALLMRFCLKNWGKIEKVFTHHLEEYLHYEYEGPSLVATVSKEESTGRFFLTNAIRGNGQNLYLTGSCFNGEMYLLESEKGGYRIEKEGEYWIRPAKMSASKMKLFNNNNACLCNIVIDHKCEISLENNLTPFELVDINGLIGVFDKGYIKGLPKGQTPDTEQCLASIEWDILDKDSRLGLAMLELYKDDLDVEMLWLFAASSFLLFKSRMASMRAIRYSQIAFMSSWLATNVYKS